MPLIRGLEGLSLVSSISSVIGVHFVIIASLIHVDTGHVGLVKTVRARERARELVRVVRGE